MGNSVESWRAAIGGYAARNFGSQDLIYLSEWNYILSHIDLRLFLTALTLLLILASTEIINPGPDNVCVLCDRSGRKNQIKLTCVYCNRIFHTKCLKLSTKEIRYIRKCKTWECSSCSLPAFSDSFFDTNNGGNNDVKSDKQYYTVELKRIMV
jgi:hypothetical protein